jgi:hypothetical protein
MRKNSAVIVGSLVAGVLAGSPASAAQFAVGDVFASTGNGQVQVYSPTGTLLQTLNTGLGGITTGSTTDSAGNFYVTDFQAARVTEFNNMGVFVQNFGAGQGWVTPESIVFDQSGTGYVGDADAHPTATTGAIHILTGGNVTVGGNNPLAQNRGTDWTTLASNQTTFYYTSEGKSVLRFDKVSGQLANFANNLPGSFAFALRILSNGNVLVADTDRVVLLDTNGNVIRTLSPKYKRNTVRAEHHS